MIILQNSNKKLMIQPPNWNFFDFFLTIITRVIKFLKSVIIRQIKSRKSSCFLYGNRNFG
jgi:hypothetical protein